MSIRDTERNINITEGNNTEKLKNTMNELLVVWGGD